LSQNEEVALLTKEPQFSDYRTSGGDPKNSFVAKGEGSDPVPEKFWEFKGSTQCSTRDSQGN